MIPSAASQAKAPAHNESNTVKGIYLVTISTLLFSLMDGLIKWTGESYPVMQLLFFRTVFAMIPISITLWKAGGLKLLKTEQPFIHFLRGTVGMCAMFFVFTSFIKLPMAEVVSITFAAPIIVSIMAAIFLKERVGIHRGLAILAGFIGVLIIIQPGPGILSSDTIYPIMAAILMATAMLILRILGKKDHGSVIAFYFTLYGIIVSSIGISVQGWIMPSGIDWILLISIGVLGGLAQYFATRSFAVAEVAVVSPFKYTALIWAATMAYLIWGEVPGWEVWAGASVIVASSLYILHRELYWAKRDIDETSQRQSIRQRLIAFLARN
ncbi:DMT family transporter [Curvivirga aplysinae]|uniref:DMT family transporter n=1 Tax=Curvivirga aplysinae TaxID=2529852 RepID=UPI0012BD5DE9|nr:DMT family transporter [Curvivirga aplysinae]MTI09987.1 DMT family transporter [Curvivirga aplysinae]